MPFLSGDLTLLDSGATASAGANSQNTGSISPAGNHLILAAIVTSRIGTLSAPTLVGNGLTWVQVGTVREDNARLTLFRAMGASPSSGEVTIQSPELSTNFGWIIVEVDKVNTTGSNGSGAVLQSATATGNEVSILIVNLAAFGHVDNATFGCFAIDNDINIVAGSGFTEIAEVGSSQQQDFELQAEWRTDNDQTVDAKWTGAEDANGIAVELVFAGTPPPPPQAGSSLRRALGVEPLAGDLLHDFPTVTITAPVHLSTISTGGPTVTVTWNYAQAQGDAQSHFRVLAVDGTTAAVYYDSGFVPGGATSSVIDVDAEKIAHEIANLIWRVHVRREVDLTGTSREAQNQVTVTMDWGIPHCTITAPVNNSITADLTGVDVGWTFTDDDVPNTQSAFRVRLLVTGTGEQLWDTGWTVSTANTFHIPVNLQDGTEYTVEVQLRNNHGIGSD